MAILFRIDVDKPFGHHSFFTKVASKISEDLNIALPFAGAYLQHCKAMIRFLTENGITGFFYFRWCTKPDAETFKLLKEGGHQIGFHAENTRSQETFRKEFELFCSHSKPVTHFTKHGSGVLKLGKNHYPPYEPDKYRQWAAQMGIQFFSGNGMAANDTEMLADEEGFRPAAFWFERAYRMPTFNTIEQVIDIARKQDVIVMTHPENFYTHTQVKSDIEQMILLAKENNVQWLQHLPEASFSTSH